MAKGYPDFEGNKSALYLKAEWAAFEGLDKAFNAAASNKAFGEYASVLYTVPAGKTLYLNRVSFQSFAFAVANADSNQICGLYITDLTTSEYLVTLGGNGGGGQTFNQPILIPTGHQVGFYVYNYANHNCTLYVSTGGYEL